MFLSIIIPYYNTSKSIFHETLFSVFNQTDKNCGFEIIIVDNGSKKPLEIDDLNFKFKEKIKIIRLEENLTIGPARNIGIKNSKGEWIFFLDSDDILDTNFFQIIKKTIEQNTNCEQIKFRNKVFKKNKKIENSICNSNPEYTKSNDFSIFNSITVWTSIYKKKFLIENEIFFINKKQNFEDIFFTLVATSFAERHKSLILINNNLINYQISKFNTCYKFSKAKKSEKISLKKERIANIISAIEFLEKKDKEILSSRILAYFITLFMPKNFSVFFYYKNKEIYKKMKCYFKKINKCKVPFINKLWIKIFRFRLLSFILSRLYSILSKILLIK